LLQRHLDNKHGRRTGLVWLLANRSDLRHSRGIFEFFRSWGGEALYAGFDDDAVGSAALRRLGRPAIVQCALPLPTDDLHGDRGGEFLSYFVANEIEHPEPSPHFLLGLQRPVLASEIVDVLAYGDPRFEALTGYSGWPAEHRFA
jgi:hypothetical protein